MKRHIAVMVAAFALALPAAAAGNPTEAITSSGKNPVFERTSCSSWRNIHNVDLRFGDNGGIAIPGAPQTGNTIPDVQAGEGVAASYDSSSCGSGEEAGFVGTPAFYEG